MKFLCTEKLSAHRYKTPEGYLVCTDAILARTGKQTYRRSEVFADSNDDSEIEIDRKPEEVFSEKTLASFENKPITVEHPNEDVNVENYKQYAVGFMRDIHKGIVNGQQVMLGTAVITDAQTIEEIENGEHTDLSCGYDCDITDEDNPQQRNIRGNHVALCQQGRAGIARLIDSKFNSITHDSYDDDIAIETAIETWYNSDPRKITKSEIVAKLRQLEKVYGKYKGNFNGDILKWMSNEGYVLYDSVKGTTMKDMIYKDMKIEKEGSQWVIYDLDGYKKNSAMSLEDAKHLVDEYYSDDWDRRRHDSVNDVYGENQYILKILGEHKFWAVTGGYTDNLRKTELFPSIDRAKEKAKFIWNKTNWPKTAYSILQIIDDNPQMLDFIETIKPTVKDSVKDAKDWDHDSKLQRILATYSDFNMRLRGKEFANSLVKKLKEAGYSKQDVVEIIYDYIGVNENDNFDVAIGTFFDSVKDAKWEVGRRVRYDGEWYYIINYSRGTWVLENENDRSQIRVSDSIKDNNTDFTKGIYVKKSYLGNNVIEVIEKGTTESVISSYNWSKQYGKDYRYRNRRFDNDIVASLLEGYTLSNSYKDSTKDAVYPQHEGKFEVQNAADGYEHMGYFNSREEAKKWIKESYKFEEEEMGERFSKYVIVAVKDSVKDATLSEMMDKIDSNPKAVEMANNLLKNPNLKFSEVVDLVYNRFFGNTNDSEIEGRVNPSEAKCNCDHPFYECGPNCDCGCKDNMSTIKAILFNSTADVTSSRFTDFIDKGLVKLGDNDYMLFWTDGSSHQEKEREIEKYNPTNKEFITTYVYEGRLVTNDLDSLSHFGSYKSELKVKASRALKDSVKNGLKTYEVHYVDDNNVTHVHLVKAKSALDAVRRNK